MKPRWLVFVFLSVFCPPAVRSASVDLAISISAPPGPMSISSNLVYTIIVTNAGSARATGVVVTNELAANVNFVSATPSQGSCSHSAGMISCDVGTLNAGSIATISIRVQPTVHGWSPTRAYVTANQEDSAPENNAAFAEPLLGLADWGLTINGVADNVVAGGTVTYVLTVTNHGPDSPPGGGVSLSLPVGADHNIIISTNISAGTFEFWNYTHPGTENAVWLFPGLVTGGSVSLTLQIWLISGMDFSFYARSLGGPTDTNSWNNFVSDHIVVTPGRGILQFAQVSQDAFEGRGTAEIEIRRTGGAVGAVQVGFATEDGTATAGDDYTEVNQTVTFSDGETKKMVPVSLFQHAQFECARDFRARLFSPGGGAMLGPKTNTTITLFDDDVFPQGTIECISVTHSNAYLAAIGYPTFFSEDGRYILFVSVAGNWLTNGDIGFAEIFLRDTLNGTTRLVSANYEGTEGSRGNPDQAVMSGNRRYVAFTSNAEDLTTNTVTGLRDVFVRDLLMERTVLASVTPDGTSGGNNYSVTPMMSSNGMVVVFASTATDLISNCQCEGYQNIFARDLSAGITRLVSKSIFPDESPNNESVLAGLSADGRLVLFWSSATNLVIGDNNGEADLFVRDLLTETTSLVSVNAAGTGSGNASSHPQAWPRITPDGRFVVFDSDASDLVSSDTNETRDVFIRDLSLSTTRLVSVNQAGTQSANGYSLGSSVTSDGRYVAFYSDATDLVSATYVRPNNVFVRDFQNNTTILASADCEGRAVGGCAIPTISGNGRYVVFVSSAPNMVPGAFPLRPDGFGLALGQGYRRDLVSGTTILVTANYEYNGGGNINWGEPFISEPSISADGKSILFANNASDLTVAKDVNATTDVFLWRELPAGTNAEVRVTSTVNARPAVMVITLTVTNFGPDTATDVMVQDQLSPGAKFITASTTVGSCIVNGGHVSCSIGTLTRRAGAVVTLVATSTANGAVAHTATVSSGMPDPLQANNAASASAPLMLPPSATLWISRCSPKIFVQWLSASPEFQLENGLLDNWSAAGGGILDNGTLKTLIIEDGGPPTQFYRLSRP